MKKIVLGLVAALCISAPALAEDAMTFSVKEEDKAAYQQQIDRYQKQAKDIITKAEADIAAAQKCFEEVKKDSETRIAAAQAQIEKAQIDAKQAQEAFEKVKNETNEKITNANARIQKASDDLKKNIAALQEKANK